MASAEITQLVVAAENGRGSAVERLLPLVYEELRAMARSMLARQRAGHTLEPTALVHEAFMRLVDQTKLAASGRAHFLAVAARAMRQILINHAEAKQARKRGGGWKKITLRESVVADPTGRVDLLELNEALKQLESLDERQARVVELRFFGGMTVEESAAILGVSPRTVDLDWRMAKAWLISQLGL